MSQILQKVAPIGESRDKEILKAASTYVFSDKDGIDLLAHVFVPEGAIIPHRPAVAFFHGGFWDTPMVTQFVPHCHHFASRGAVCVAFEYRVASKHQTGPLAAIEDSRAALLWLHDNAELLGIDPGKIAVSGAAGGAFLCLLLAMQKDKQFSTPVRPKALVLFSALLKPEQTRPPQATSHAVPAWQVRSCHPFRRGCLILPQNEMARESLPAPRFQWCRAQLFQL
jgi:acetyl esterase/lipase